MLCSYQKDFLVPQNTVPFMTEAFNATPWTGLQISSFCLFSNSYSLVQKVISPHYFSLQLFISALCLSLQQPFWGVSVLPFWVIGLFISPLCMFPCINRSTHTSKPPLNANSQYCLAVPNPFPYLLLSTLIFLFFLIFVGDALLAWIWLKHNLLHSHQWIEL